MAEGAEVLRYQETMQRIKANLARTKLEQVGRERERQAARCHIGTALDDSARALMNIADIGDGDCLTHAEIAGLTGAQTHLIEAVKKMTELSRRLNGRY